MLLYEESDEYCPHCDNHYVRFFGCLLLLEIISVKRYWQVIEAKIPRPVLGVEGEDTRVDNRYDWDSTYETTKNWIAACRMLKDDRARQTENRSW